MTLLPAGRTKATALNVGSGPRPTGDLTFLYVDRTAWPVDVMADLRSLPFRDGTFSHVHCSHTIEHIPRSEVIAALRELRRVLHPDGVMYVAAPDMERARSAGSTEWVEFTRRGGWKPGWEHRWVCSVRLLRRLLFDAGWVPTWAKAPPPGSPPNTHQWPPDFEARFACRRDDYPWPAAFPGDWQVVA
jgi:predicted SAM-dependent methyltransferase